MKPSILFPQKHKVIISMDGQQDNKILQLKVQQLKNLKTLKKKILNKFNYQQSQIKKIQINLIQLYPTQPLHLKIPVHNQSNLKLIIDFLISYQRPIKIHITLTNNQTIKKKQPISQQSIAHGQIHFDQNGSLIQQTDQMKQILPSNPKYDNTVGHIRCQFCHKNNQDIKYLKKCGGLYGPFQSNQYVHILCAIWCHQVYIDSTTGLLRNVQEEIQRASKLKCKLCRQDGAGLTCDGYYRTRKNKKQKCLSQYHFKCLFQTNCAMNWLTFKFLCPSCKQDDQLLQCLFNQKKLIKQIINFDYQFNNLSPHHDTISYLNNDKQQSIISYNSQSSLKIKKMFIQ